MRRIGDERGNEDRLVELGELSRALVHGRGDVDEEEDGERTILAVGTDEGFAEPRGRVPVDEAGVIVGVVLPERVELDAPAPEDRTEIAPREGAREGRRREEQPPDPIVEFVRLCAMSLFLDSRDARHYGSVRAERTRAMTASASIPSASAS